MRQRPDGQPTAKIVHPNDDSIYVIIRKLTRAQEIDRADEIRTKYTRAIAIQNADGSACLDDSGNQRTYVVTSFPSSFIVRSLRLAVESWSGIEDSGGRPIVFDAGNPADDKHVGNAGILIEDFLDVVEIVPVTRDGAPVVAGGKPETREARRAFSGYILDKLYEPATFDSDPKTNSSVSQ